MHSVSKAFGPPANGIGPPELFSSGYAACLLISLQLAAQRDPTLKVPEDITVRIETHVGALADGRPLGFAADIYVESNDLDKENLRRLTAQAYELCPYSIATKGQLDTGIHVQ